MTAFGKTLTFLMMLVAVPMAIWATTVYSQRPSWFDGPDSTYEKAAVLTFKGLTTEIDAAGKLAALSSRDWGVALKNLEAREKVYRARQPGYAQRLEWAQKGKDVGAKGKKGGNRPGFFEERAIPNTATPDLTRGLTDLDPDAFPTDKTGNPVTIKGPDGRDLQGADTLLDDYHRTVVQITGDPADAMKPGLVAEIAALREEEKQLQAQIVVAEVKLLKQLRIRDEVTGEVLYLRDFRITVGGQKDTVYERKKQLEDRLRQLVAPATKK
ncbi:MAG: hypothetical protein K2P78_11760 [Gemmataceae bacterium]|nr:hypothetical protein [Gemmataceae bacterium]